MSYYDYKALVVQHRSSTHLGEVEKDWFKFDLWGKPLVTTLMIVASPVFRVDSILTIIIS